MHNHGPSAHDSGAHAHGLTTEKRLVISIVLNFAITIAQAIGGVLSGSIALLSDALHNFSDASSLVVSFVARRLTRRAATERMTFGYRRAEIVGAFINLVTLAIVSILLLKEAFERIASPQIVDIKLMLVVATIGLIANVVTALLLQRDSKTSVNIRSAYIHILMDAASSVAVILGGLLMWWKGWHVVDPILSAAIAIYILFYGVKMLRSVTDILMEGTPEGIDIPTVIERIESIHGVADAHHLHVWQLDEQSIALEAHISVETTDWATIESLKSEIKSALHRDFRIRHATLEFEAHTIDCDTHDDCYGAPSGQDLATTVST